MSMTGHTVLHWTPRILGILYAGLVSLFALDAWGTEAGFWRELAGFLVHLLPTYFILAALLIAWVRPRAGGLLFILLAVAMGFFFGWDNATTVLIVVFLPMVLGLLFIAAGSMMPGKLRPRH